MNYFKLITNISILFILFFNDCVTPDNRSKIEKHGETLLGFTQFDLYKNSKDYDKLLGSVPNQGDFEKVYEGNLFKSEVKNELSLIYDSSNKYSASAKIQGLFSFGSSLDTIKQVKLTLINPREDILQNSKLLSRYKENPNIPKKKYIGSLLYAEKVKLEVITKQGINFDAEGYAKQVPGLKLGTGVSSNSSGNELIFAEDVYVGYKLKNFNGDFSVPEKDQKIVMVVMPFAVDSPDKEPYSVSIMDASCNTMSSLGATVLERNSYQKDLEKQGIVEMKVAEELRANTILSGKIRFSGDEMRISSKLIRENNTIVKDSDIDVRINIKDKKLFDIEDEWKKILKEKYSKIEFNKKEIPTQTASPNNNETSNEEAYKYFIIGREKYLEMSEASLNESIEYFKKSIKSDQSYSKAHAALSEAYSSIYYLYRYNDEEDYKRYITLSKREIEKAYKLDPTSPDVNRAYGIYFDLAEGNPAKAKEFFQKTISLKPDDSDANIFLTYNETFKKFTDDNKQKMLNAYNLNPNSFYSNQLYGYWLKASGSKNEAMEKYNRAISTLPKVPLMYILAADLANEMGNIELMQSILEKAVKAIPNNFYVYQWLSSAYELGKQLDKAINYAQESLKLKPNNYKMVFTLGNMYKTKGDLKRSKEYWKEACEKGKFEEACKMK